MKNTFNSAEARTEARKAWNLKDFNLNFRNRERYKAAVRILMNSDKYQLVRNGRYLSGPEYGYVAFRKRA